MRSGQAGITLIEMLIASGIFMVLAAVLSTMLLTGRDTFLTSEAAMQSQQEARRALDVTARELREAGQFNNPTSQRLDFQVMRGYDSEDCGGVCWGSETAEGQWIHYVLNTTNALNIRLVRCVTADRDNALAQLSGCRVLANNVVSGAFSIQYDAANQLIALQLQTTARIQSGNTRAVNSPVMISGVRPRNL